MAEGDSAEDRTEAATPRRTQRAREEGNVPISRELTSFAGLVAATLILLLYVPGAAHRMTLQLGLMLAQADRWDLSDSGAAAMSQALWVTLRMIVWPIAASSAAVILTVLLQSGFALRDSVIRFDLSHVSPLAGLRRLVGAEHMMEALKSLLKTVVIALVLFRALHAIVDMLQGDPFWDMRALLRRTMQETLHGLLAVLVVQAVIAIGDVAWVRYQHGRRLRMTREDIRDEMKDTDGNPLVRAKLRQLRQARARKRMMAQVPKATVVITNPTHYAVALAYDRNRNAAPRVVAKGLNEVAERIRALAQQHRVPLVANPPLARALFQIDLDQDIPPEHYKAVATIIAYVWRLQRRVRAAA